MKIFIVEDSSLMRARIAEAAMSVEGVQITGQAGDLNGVYSGIRGTMPDALIVDIQLLDGSGLAVLKQIKSERPEIKSVVLSNSSTSQYRHVAFMAGADYFLDKSTEFSQLTEILTNWQAHSYSCAPTGFSDATTTPPSVQLNFPGASS